MPAPPFVRSRVFADLPIRHGFFGRQGGHSEGVYASNNMSIAAGDDPAVVDRNRDAAARALGRQRRDLLLLKQVHSTRVIAVAGINKADVAIEADAMVSNDPHILLGILTADCAPVLLADPVAGVVGAAHAGWKGAAGRILANTVEAMLALGASPGRIRAAIGPTISAANYEIGPDTAAQIVALDPAAAAHIAIPKGATREHFDIPGLLQQQLLELGVGLVGNVDLCTYADPDAWFSHRYATHHSTTTGRQISIIGLGQNA